MEPAEGGSPGDSQGNTQSPQQNTQDKPKEVHKNDRIDLTTDKVVQSPKAAETGDEPVAPPVNACVGVGNRGPDDLTGIPPWGRMRWLPGKAMKFKRKLRQQSTGAKHFSWYFNELTEPTDEGHTHQCKECRKTLKANRNQSNGTWFNTKLVKHLKDSHPDTVCAQKMKEEAAASKKKRVANIQNSILASWKRRAANDDEAKQNFLAAQADFFTYSRANLPKSLLDDPLYRKMLDEAVLYGRAGGKLGPRYNSRSIEDCIDAEYNLFRSHLRKYLGETMKYNGGNACAQGMHDAVTLDSSVKHLALGIALPSLELDRNWMICYGFDACSEGDTTAVGTMKKMQKTFFDVTGKQYLDVVHDTVSDGASGAIKVAELLGQLRRICGMHEGDKVARSCIGDLTRSRGKVVQNPFVDAQRLLAEAQKCAKYFSYGHRMEGFKQQTQVLVEGVPDIKPQTDICATRVAARRNMVLSLLRLNKGLKVYARLNNKVPWNISDSDWIALRDMEAVMNIVAEFTTLVQTEKIFMRAVGIALQQNLLEQLRSESIRVVDIESVTATDTQPRKAVSVDNLTPIGRNALGRAQLEAERRFCGTKGLTLADISGMCKVKVSRLDQAALLMDPRTFKWAGKFLVHSQKEDAKETLREEYIAFAKTYHNLDGDGHRASDGSDSGTDDGWSDGEEDVNDANLRFDKEFQRAWRAWKDALRRIDWKKLWPEVTKRDDLDLANPMNLIDAPVHKVLLSLRDQTKFGLLSIMATHSKVGIGPLQSASFCERVNSMGNHIQHKNNTRLAPAFVAKLTLLRMNREFILYLRQRYKEDPIEVDQDHASE